MTIQTNSGLAFLRQAREVLVASFLNLEGNRQRAPTAQCPGPAVICSGTFEEAAYEDVLGAGVCAIAYGLYILSCGR